MGNLQSGWLRRIHGDHHHHPQQQQDVDAGVTNPNDQGQSSTDPAAVGQSPPEQDSRRHHRLPYQLRRTLARLRRHSTPHSTASNTIGREGRNVREPSLPSTSINNRGRSLNLNQMHGNSSTSSLSSTGSRRRPREEDDMFDTNETQRVRVESIAREAFTPSPVDTGTAVTTGPSMFFYFSLPMGDEPSSNPPASAVAAATTPSSNGQGRREGGGEEPRRSGRLHQAADFLRGRFGRSQSTRREQASASPLEETNQGENVGQNGQQLVLVRIRQVPVTATTEQLNPVTSPHSQSPTAQMVPNSAPSSSPSNNTTEEDANNEQRFVFQWTIYFVLPNSENTSMSATNDPLDIGPDIISNSSNNLFSESPQRNESPRVTPNNIPPPPPTFDPTTAVQRVFAVLSAMMSGENMTFEDWTRFQELMGFVSRGVNKDQINEQLSTKTFVTGMALEVGHSCPICLSDYVLEERVRTLPCAHTYHADCIDTWLGACNNCPLCRQQPVQLDPS